MNIEMQTDEVVDDAVTDVDQQTETENPDQFEQPEGEAKEEGAESSTAEESKVTFDEAQQAKVNQLIGEKVSKQREAERQAEELQRRLAEVEASLPKEKRPEIPAMPDPFDDDFEEQSKARDAAIIKQAEFDATARANERLQQQAQQEAARRQQAALETELVKYSNKAKASGIDQNQMVQDMQAVGQNIPDVNIQAFLLTEEKGPEITNFLASNPLEMDKVRNMNQMQAAIYIETQLKPKATQSRKTSNAPAPADTLSGRGAPPKERGPKGAKFE